MAREPALGALLPTPQPLVPGSCSATPALAPLAAAASRAQTLTQPGRPGGACLGGAAQRRVAAAAAPRLAAEALVGV